MLKSKQKKLLDECNFNKLEEDIFNNLVEEKSRIEIFEIMKKDYGISRSTFDRAIKKIANKIKCYENGNKENYKIYIHKFPNGKKYVGVCQNCKERWNNGRGYAYNDEMYEAIKKYGWDNIEHKILLEVSNSKLAYEIEKTLINELDLIKKGYNNQ